MKERKDNRINSIEIQEMKDNHIFYSLFHIDTKLSLINSSLLIGVNMRGKHSNNRIFINTYFN